MTLPEKSIPTRQERPWQANAVTRAWKRARLALQRGLARADSWLAAIGFYVAGLGAADERWLQAGLALAVGVVFLVAAGDYTWRKGYAEGKRSSS